MSSISRLLSAVGCSLLLIPTVGMGSFAGFRADITKLDLEIVFVTGDGYCNLAPMTLANHITIIELGPKNDAFLQRDVFGKFLAGELDWKSVVVETFDMRGNGDFSIMTGGFMWFFDGGFYGDNSVTGHQSDVEGRGFPCVLDRELDSELFVFFQSSLFPSGVGIFSCLDSVFVIAQPRPLIQVCSFPSEFQGLPGNIEGFLSKPEGVLARFYGVLGRFSLVPSEVGVSASYSDESKSHQSVWPYTLGLILAFGLCGIGAHLVFFVAFRREVISWGLLVLGVFFILVGYVLIHATLGPVNDWIWEWQKS